MYLDRLAVAASVSALAVLLCLPTAVSAQGMGQGSGGPGMGMGMGMGPGRMLPDPAMLPGLKAKLGITAAQEPQWTVYADGVSSADEMRRQMQKGAREMAPAERMETRPDRQAAGAQVHEGLNQRRDDLARVLTPEQRAILDREAPPLPPPPKR
ncbi:Spy/CpxP family protein refolding chaperone [Magnetospirillum molischianum]|nr:Spy/CpxP family protein refolding chaperone [Magnetospirillum molischianum]